MAFSVYKITNTINGFIYIGATCKPIEVRFYQHCRNKKYQYPLYNDIRTYGESFFNIEIIEECKNKKQMSEKESFWIKYYSRLQPGILYNIKKPFTEFITSPNHTYICNDLKARFSRTQGWLAKEIGMSESFLSKKINDIVDWKQDELDKINKVLHTDFKL